MRAGGHVLLVDPDPRIVSRIIKRFNVVAVVVVVVENHQRVGGIVSTYRARKLDIPPSLLLSRGLEGCGAWPGALASRCPP